MIGRRVTGLLAALAAGSAVFAGAVSAQAASSPRPAPVRIAVNAARAGSVGSGFAGFSYEKDRIGAGVFDASDTNLVKLFRLLGPSVLRLGGNLNDIVRWNPAGKGGSASEVAPSDVTRLAAFLKATGWSAIYGINLKTNTTANAASEAAFVAHALGTSLLTFEIGNEPNFYRTESTYEASFNTYVAAIRKVVPGAVFDGPGQGDSTTWVNAFAAHEKNNGLTILSTHIYIGNKTTATVAGMLASNSSGRLPAAESVMDRAQSANGIAQWRMTEANSYFHGGTAGVSDVEAASLWSLDFMDGIAAHHGSGVNFHGGTSTQFPLNYTPIRFSGIKPTGVQGVYYGELLWSMAGTGPLHNTTVTGASNVTAWGIGNNVIVDNKGTGAVTTTLTLAGPATTAQEYVLTAPSLTSTAITIAGSAVAVTGSFTPAPRSLTVTGATVTVTIPAHSAALVRTQ